MANEIIAAENTKAYPSRRSSEIILRKGLKKFAQIPLGL
jgi:hypothetical protein